MSFLFAKTPRQAEKEAQLNALLVGFHGNSDFRPHRADQLLYEILIRNNNTISNLVIRITEKFPDTKPDIIVKGHLASSGHTWIGNYGTVKGCKKLNEWNKATSSLVEIVKEIVAALQAGMVAPTQSVSQLLPSPQSISPFPPSIQQIQNQIAQQSTYQYQPPPIPLPLPVPIPSGTVVGISNVNPIATSIPTSTAASRSGSHSDLAGITLNNPASSTSSSSADASSSFNNQTQRTPKPPIPASFPQLHNLSESQLERMLSDPVAMMATLQNFVEVDSLREYRNTIRRKNHDTATDTLLREHELERVTKDINEAQKKLQVLAKEYNDALEEKKKLFFVTEKTVMDEARKNVAVLDATSTKIRHKLIAGAVKEETISEFIKEYLTARTSYHALKLKVDALSRP